MPYPAPDFLPSSRASNQAIGVVLTLTTLNTTYNLYSLLAAIDPNVARNCFDLTILNQGATIIAVGKSTMATIADGEQIVPTGYHRYGSNGRNNVSLTQLYLISDGNTGKVVITALVG